jgi:CRISPR-associated exonuclease Cas4
MFEADVPLGCLYSVSSRQRTEVPIDAALRDHTVKAIEEVRRQLDEMLLPPAPNDERCPRCSLIDTCLPGVVAESRRLVGLQASLFQPAGMGSSDA